MALRFSIPSIIVYLMFPFQFGFVSSYYRNAYKQMGIKWPGFKVPQTEYDIYQNINPFIAAFSAVFWAIVFSRLTKKRLTLCICQIITAIIWLIYLFVNPNRFWVAILARALQGVFHGIFALAPAPLIYDLSNDRNYGFFSSLIQATMFLSTVVQSFMFYGLQYDQIAIISAAISVVFAGIIWLTPESMVHKLGNNNANDSDEKNFDEMNEGFKFKKILHNNNNNNNNNANKNNSNFNKNEKENKKTKKNQNEEEITQLNDANDKTNDSNSNSNNNNNSNNRDNNIFLNNNNNSFNSALNRKSTVFSRKYLRNTFTVIIIMIFQQVCGITIIMRNMTKMVSSIGIDVSPYIVSGVVNFIGFLSTFVAGFVSDVVGRKFLWIFSCLGTFTGLLIYGSTVIITKQNAKNPQNEAKNLENWVGTLGVFVYFLFYGLGMGPIPWLLSGEMFPRSLKVEASGVVSFTNFSFSVIVAYIFPALEKKAGEEGAILFFTGMSFIALVVGGVFLPGAKGKESNNVTII